MGTCKYCEKSIPLGNLKSHYKEHSMGSKSYKDVIASKEDCNVQTSKNNEDNVPISINNEDTVAPSKEDKNVQENCISSSSSPSDQMICSESQENTAESIDPQKDMKSSKNALEVSCDNNKDYMVSDQTEKSVASSSQSQSDSENNLTMVIVKRELLDLEDSDLLNIKKEVDPLADDLIISDQPEGGSAKVIIDQSNER